VLLAYWDYSTEDQGQQSLFEVVGVMACLPGFPSQAGWTNAADEWAWSPLIVSGASCGSDDEESEAFSMPHTIPGVGFERQLRLPLWYKWQGAKCRPPCLAYSIFK
jgi:hypothetical protein